MYRVVLCPEVGVVTVVGDSHRGGAGRPCGRREKTGAATPPPRAGQNSAAVRAADSALHLNMKYKLSLVLKRAAARARKETVYHYTTEPQTCVLAS